MKRQFDSDGRPLLSGANSFGVDEWAGDASPETANAWLSKDAADVEPNGAGEAVAAGQGLAGQAMLGTSSSRTKVVRAPLVAARTGDVDANAADEMDEGENAQENEALETGLDDNFGLVGEDGASDDEVKDDVEQILGEAYTIHAFYFNFFFFFFNSDVDIRFWCGYMLRERGWGG